MKKQKRVYPESFKEQAISLLRSSGRSAADIERELGIRPGYSSAGSGFFSHYVDNINYSYTLRLDFNGATDDTLRICAGRFRYNYNISTGYLPAVLNLVNP